MPLGEDNLFKYGIKLGGKPERWNRTGDGGRKWGRHVWGVLEMSPPPADTLLDIGKERLLPAEGGAATQRFLQVRLAQCRALGADCLAPS